MIQFLSNRSFDTKRLVPLSPPSSSIVIASQCQEATASSVCASCKDGFVLSADRKSCLSSCPAEYFADASSSPVVCSACLTNCNSCGNSTTCDECTNSKFLPANKESCDSICLSGFYENGTGVTGRTCEPCLTGCNSCSDTASCSTCTPPLLLAEDKHACLDSCPAGFFNAGSKCTKCFTDCELCSDGVSCATCGNSKALISNQTSCAASCPAGFFSSGSGVTGRECKPCGADCVLCTSSASCTTCGNGKHLRRGTDCDSDCGAGFFKAGTGTTGRTCEPCLSGCDVCTDAAR